MKKILAIICLIIITSACSTDTKIDISGNIKLKKNQLGILFFVQLGNCVACNIPYFLLIEELEKESDSENYKICALINCSRQMELSIFKRKYNWKYNLMKIDNNFKNIFDLKKNTQVFVINYQNKILFSAEEVDSKAKKRILEIIN